MTVDDVTMWLRANGWSPDRDIGQHVAELVRIRSDDAVLQGRRLAVSDKAVQFIRTFGELELPLPRGSAGAVLILDPTAGYDGDVEDFEELAAGLGRRVFPVGVETDEFGIWLIDEDGRFFLHHHTGNYFLGGNAQDAFAAAFFGKVLPVAEDYFCGHVERVLRTAGWSPGRQIDTGVWRQRLEGSGFRWSGAADRFLAEFGGLVVAGSGPGITSAREPFELDPLLAEGEDDRFAGWAEVIGESITPVGELDSGRYFLGVAESSELYLVADWLGSFGRLPEALEAVILGRAPVPVIDEHRTIR
ncbi:SUKH-3 domain-containing protein [Nocardia yamanashiensis]|uniref:SUKH-3 domain-containing protein n=1 Tax=Nocardia yamanashiensis TaxID=209247 RepID=UPI000A06A6B5|nr:SUKH-3 domain-containing protein [Nocardia yamanashiensis]